MNSCSKGKRGERAFRDELREAGYLKAYRGRQYSGRADAPDVVCDELPTIHFEVKCTEAGNPYKWLEQAERDALNGKTAKIPVVAHKRNGKPWLAILPMAGFFEILRQSDLPSMSEKASQPSVCLEHFAPTTSE
jgi:Holliday junction resolvase